MNYKRWNKLFLVSLSLLVSLTILFNFFIDPYSVFNTFKVEGLNKVKNHSINSAMSKFYNIKKTNINIVILGTSRSEYLNPNYLIKYYNGKIYNMSLKNANIEIIYRNLKYLIDTKDLKVVVIGLDLFSFNPAHKKDKLNKQDRYNNYYLNDYKDSLLSFRTLRKSFKTLKDNLSNKEHKMDYSTGWETGINTDRVIKEKGISIIRKMQEKTLRLYATRKINYNNENFKNKYSINNNINILNNIIKLCSNYNVKLHMFISPISEELTNLIHNRGYTETYNYWKTKLSEYENIYDFSGYNSITTDISNYIDGSHYQAKLGPLIFARIFNDTSVKIPDDFGIRLDKSSIDSILNQRKLYITNNLK